MNSTSPSVEEVAWPASRSPVLAEPHSVVQEFLRLTPNVLVEEIRFLEGRMAQPQRELIVLVRHRTGWPDFAEHFRHRSAHGRCQIARWLGFTSATLSMRDTHGTLRMSMLAFVRAQTVTRTVLTACLFAFCFPHNAAAAEAIDSWGVTVAHGRSFVVGPRASRFMLMRKDDLRPRVSLPTEEGSSPKPMALAVAVDLSADQTPVRSQGSRDTCTVFSVAAAVEAAYKRKYGTSLDLSEQYFNHVVQINRGVEPARPIPFNETNAGSSGGGGIDINAFIMLRGGLAFPLETTMGYIGDQAYQEPNAGDIPDLMNYGAMHTQREVDDFNLSEVARDYQFPFALRTTVLPQAALETAVYRATAVVAAAPSDLSNVDWYRAQLAASREVVIQIRCCDGNPGFHSKKPWNLPAGSDGGRDGHALLLVGYDDRDRTFLVKNSWGTAWANGGYARMSYDYVRTAAQVALSFLDIADPAQGETIANNHQLYLGRWNLDFDGTQAILDIYGLPRIADNGLHLNRLGTLFRGDGKVFRVNGEATGNAIDFWIDWSNPDPASGVTSGMHFHGFLFSHDRRSMAGFFDGPGSARAPFEAVKGPDPVIGVAEDSIPNLMSTVGTWRLNEDGRLGVLNIVSVEPTSRAIKGTHTDEKGVVRNVTGTVQSDSRSVAFEIPFTTPSQAFDAMLNSSELGVMAGETIVHGVKFGFIATRVGPPTSGRDACLAQCTRDRDQCFAVAHSGTARGVCLQTYNACNSDCPG